MPEKRRTKVVISHQMFVYMQPIVVISRVVGLSPIKYEKIGNQYVLSISYFYVAYSYIFGLVLALSAILGLVRDLQASPEYSLRIKDTKGAYVVCCDLGFMILIVILGIFISPFKIDKFFLILDSLSKVHRELPASENQNQRKASFLFSLVSYSVFLGVLSYDFVGWCIQTKGKPSSSRLWHNIPVYMLYVVSWTQEICFWHLTYFVKRCVMAFNDGLALYSEDGKVRTEMEVSKGFKSHEYGGQNVFSVDNMGRISAKDTLKKNVLTTEKAEMFIHVHRILFGAVNLINDWYGIPLLLILLSCFLQLIGTPYFMISNTAEKSMVFAILEVVWLFTHTSRLLIIVEASDRCVKEYDKINFLLCQHLERNYDQDTMNKLELLALQINTCKVRFSTCGVANINRSLLATITGAVTTYLVILVQLNDDNMPALKEQTTQTPL